MGIFTLHLIALGLAMDAFAVSVSNGICYKKTGPKQAFKMAFVFGLFQAGMPLIGYYAGSTVSEAVAFLDHWIALVLLTFIGTTMVYGAVKGMRNPEIKVIKTVCTFRELFVQGVATSIDAFAVGISFAVIQTNIYFALFLIGIDTFVCCFIGVFLGKRFGGLLQEKAEFFGGVILILIGVKIFVEHMLK
ncbi:MAG: manganese efflux pump MntP family protein [Eubacteriales bacterium]|nr:manganese efflux pump MntP family protein [Eubacteriales bacterium]